MEQNRYFSVDPIAYEQSRVQIDSLLNLQNQETCISPASVSQKDADGNVLISIRVIHCSSEPFYSVINSLLNNGSATEITKNEYESFFPKGGIADLL